VLLAVDIGNTNIVFGVFAGESLVHTFRISTQRTRTADEHGVLVRQLLEQRGVGVAAIESSIVASVVPPLTEVLAETVRLTFAREPLVVGPGIKTGIAVLYENPREVGADRIVNAVAAFERVKGPCIVVDFGTATTFDCISAKAEYVGGVIVPGIQVSLEALLKSAAKLSRVELAAPPRVVGRNTTHAIQAGVVHGYAALVDGLVRKLEKELGYDCQVIATGGLAGLVAPHTETLQVVDQNLTLDGLRLLHERNSARPSSSGPRWT
jgi:type III pantothenate kinase